MSDLIDLNQVTHVSNAAAKLDEMRRIFDRSADMYRSYPKPIKDEIEDNISSTQIHNSVASVLSFVNPKLREEMSESLDDVRNFILQMASLGEGESAAMPIPEDELEVIQEMMVFAQRMGKKSLRQLKNFLEASNEDEWGCLLLVKNRDGVEARHRYHLGDSISEYFDI